MALSVVHSGDLAAGARLSRLADLETACERLPAVVGDVYDGATGIGWTSHADPGPVEPSVEATLIELLRQRFES